MKQSPPETIRSGKRIAEVLKGGARAGGGMLNLTWLEGQGEGLRLSVVVPKRTGSAAARNRIRRVLREEARLALGPNGGGRVDAVLLWKPEISPDTDENKARAEARRLLKRISAPDV